MNTRRGVLLGGGTALATALAGCNSRSGNGGDSDGNSDGDSDDEPETTFEPLNAIPASMGSGPDVNLTVRNIGRLAEFDSLSLDWAVGGPCWNPDPGDFETHVWARNWSASPIKELEVWTGSFDKAAFRDSMERDSGWLFSFDEFREAGTTGQFDLYEAMVNSTVVIGVVAISDEVAVVADTEDLLDDALAAEAGEADRYVDENSTYDEFRQHTDYRDVVSLDDAGSREPYVATGRAVQAGSDDSDVTGVYIFEDATAAESADIEPDDYYEDYVDSRSVAGRTQVVDYTVPTDDLFTRHETAVPEVHFEFEYDRDAETLTITHVCGDTVQAGDLEITRLEGNEWGTWAELDPSKVTDSTVTGGDSIVLDTDSNGKAGIPPDYRVRVMWWGREYVGTSIASDSGPEA